MEQPSFAEILVHIICDEAVQTELFLNVAGHGREVTEWQDCIAVYPLRIATRQLGGPESLP
jgi:hypothetical protein